ncbi:hypothetical protein pb186bvf_018849 [Paramecium bursaria]
MNQSDVSDHNILKQQVEEYKTKYFQSLKEIESKNKEIEGLRQMIQSTQSLKGTDGRQAEDLRRNLQMLLTENQQFKQQVQELTNQLQNNNPINQQVGFNQQYELNRLNNELVLKNSLVDQLNQQLDQKNRDYDQLKFRFQAIDFIQNIPPGQEANKILVQGKEIQRLNKILVTREEEIEQLRSSIQNQDQLKNERDNLSNLLRIYEDRIRNLSQEIETMILEIGKLRSDVFLKQEVERLKTRLLESEKEQLAWKEKYQTLEMESKNIADLQRKVQDYETRIIRGTEENERLEQENRGIQLKLQGYERILKDKENLERKIQEFEANHLSIEQQMNEKRRENENLRVQQRDREQDFINFKENIHRPLEERLKRQEMEMENWRNKCLALESNFYGNNERIYVENEIKRFQATILQLQSENDELRRRRPQQNNFGEDQKSKILIAERERLYIELEEARKKIQVLERKQIKQVDVIQFDDEDKDQKVRELEQGIDQLIEENKQLKQEIDVQQVRIEQLEIDKNYALSKQNAPQEHIMDIMSRPPNLHQSQLEQLCRRLYKELKTKEQQMQVLSVSQQIQREQKIADLEQQLQTLLGPQQSLQNSRMSGSPNKKKIFEESNIQRILDENLELKKQLDEIRMNKDYEVVELLDQKETIIEGMKQRFNGNNQQIDTTDIKRYRDQLEQKAYEAQEWKDKFYQLQMQQRNKENLSYQQPLTSGLLEQEYRKMRQLYEMKAVEVDNLRQQYGQEKSEPLTNVDQVKLKRLLELRTAELEEWKNRCLKLQMQAPQSQVGLDEDQIKKIKFALESKVKESDDWRIKYFNLLKGQQQQSGVPQNNNAIDELQYELTKQRRLHELKTQELQELMPKIQRMQQISQERDILEGELRKIKYALEQQVQENEQLRKRGTGTPQLANGNDKLVIRDYQAKIQQLQQQNQQLNQQLEEFGVQNSNLKQVHQQKFEQIKSIAINSDNKDAQNRQLFDENQKLKQLVDQKSRDIDDLKSQLQKVQLVLQTQNKEFQDFRKQVQSQEQFKAQMAIMQNKVQESEKKVQSAQQDVSKVQNVLRDKMQENEKLKVDLQKVQLYQQEKNQVVQQLQQAKTAIQDKQKENEQLKAQLKQISTQYQKFNNQIN